MAGCGEVELERGPVRAGNDECVPLEDVESLLQPSCFPDGKCIKVQGSCVSYAVAKELAMRGAAPPSRESEQSKVVRALLAEAIGTGMIVLIGCGSVCSSLSGAYNGIWQVAVVWGLGVALAIYCTAEASGAHLNPAITLAFQLVRPAAHGMTWSRSVAYIMAQFVGAILAGMINLLVYSDTIEAFERENSIVRGEPASIKTAMAFGEYFPNPGLSKEWGTGPFIQSDVSVAKALGVEAWGTCVLAFVIFNVTHARNNVIGDRSRPAAPLLIGLTVAVLLALYAPITQAGWNPARDFGPRLVAALAGWGKVAIPGPRNGFWVYIVGPFLGAPLGAALAENVLWRRSLKLK